MDSREKRGVAIATSRIDRKNGVWLVPSQSTRDKRYSVNLAQKTCTCPDYTKNGFICKHIYAVTMTLKRELAIDGVVDDANGEAGHESLKVSYPQNWPAYNAAQTNEKDYFQALLNSLCREIPQPSTCSRGRDRTLFSDAIFAAVFKVYSTVSTRRFMSDLRAAFEKGYLTKSIHYNSICAYLENAMCTPILHDLVVKSSLPLKSVEVDFAVDSSGFSTSRFVRWVDEKWGRERSGHDWVKCHLMCGVKTNIVTSVVIRSRDANDAPLFGPLVKTTAKNFTMREISGDKGYLSEQNLKIVLDTGAQPFIPFKMNSTPDKGGLWAKMFHFFSLNQKEFLQHYHKRSNVETTFSMIKAKFGDHVRSRTDVAMKNEVLCKVLCHNICCLISAAYELGIDPFSITPSSERPKMLLSRNAR